MGNSHSVQVANAYEFDLWVTVNAEKVTEIETDHEVGVNIEVGVGVGLTGGRSKAATITNEFTSGFTKIPTGVVTSFKPDVTETETVYITIAFNDADGKQQMLAENLPHGKSHAVIVDQRGGIIDALSSEKPSIDNMRRI